MLKMETSSDAESPIFRLARPEEDDLLSRILCNAFLPVWNHNWFHGTKSRIAPVPIGTTTSTTQITGRQRSRVKFYLALIKLTRLLNGGTINVATAPNDGTTILAILLWLPPHNGMDSVDLTTLYRSGYLSLIAPWRYGLRGLHRIQFVFEANIGRMFNETLPTLALKGLKKDDGAFVQMLASNPEFAGKGHASALLEHQCQRHLEEFPTAPVLLDTTTTQAIRAYEKLGFKVLARRDVNTGTDAEGIKLKKGASEEVKRKGREECVQRVMIRLPEGLGNGTKVV